MGDEQKRQRKWQQMGRHKYIQNLFYNVNYRFILFILNKIYERHEPYYLAAPCVAFRVLTSITVLKTL